DRRAAILPSDAPPEVSRVSPLESSIRYLTHLREAWDHAHPDAPFADQDVTVTIPASFDPAARELTAEAARAAGYS
ncbi:Hsp70 family protein, partial [Escherichia coli]|nr:Hsp70 family protein [Escherichia coli]